MFWGKVNGSDFYNNIDNKSGQEKSLESIL